MERVQYLLPNAELQEPITMNERRVWRCWLQWRAPVPRRDTLVQPRIDCPPE
jgi:hypothetical protein